jgi:SAM-dependent methyltransferase
LPSPDRYIHGFSPGEQVRLLEQAEVLAPAVLDGLNLTGARNLLEIGCGVGAELRLMAGHWPRLHLTGLDLSPSHLGAAAVNLTHELAAGQVALVRGNAFHPPFADRSFDRVVTIWVLEHLADPVPVLREALRLLTPRGELICTEVDNARFGFAPEQPAIAEWWQCFNRYQSVAGGNPFVGAGLAEAAREAGAAWVEARPLRIMDSRAEPGRRLLLLDYLRDLLSSGAANMRAAGYVDAALEEAMQAEFHAVRAQPQVHFHYHGVRLRCGAPTPDATSGKAACR